MISHDHNFKNIFLDFPKESIACLLPEDMSPALSSGCGFL